MTDQPKPISEEELSTMEELRKHGLPCGAADCCKLADQHERLIAEVRRLKDALGMYGMLACWDGYQTWSPPAPELRSEPGWVLARKVLGWSEPSEPCENPFCDGVKDDLTDGERHRCFKDGRWLDDGSEM